MHTFILALFAFLLLSIVGLTVRNEYRNAGSGKVWKRKPRTGMQRDTHVLYSLLLPYV